MSHGKAPSKLDDAELIRQADLEIAGERLLVAARLLQQVQKKEDLLTEHHKVVIHKAQLVQETIDIHLQPPTKEEGWKKQTESHGNRDTIIDYKVEGSSKLTCRIETPIESSLLVPLLAVFNESDLYQSWMPQFRIPFKLGVRESKKLRDQPGRGAQVVHVTVDMPFPVADRDLVYETWAVDAIDELDLISMKGVSLHSGASTEGLDVPPPLPGIKRIDFDAGFVIRLCPPDHPCLKNSKHKYPEDEHLLLLSLTQYVNAHVDYIPQSLINFCTRTALRYVLSQD